MKFTIEDKIKYYRKRVNDKLLTENQRKYAKDFLKKHDNNYFIKLNYHINRLKSFDYKRLSLDKKSFQFNFSDGYVYAYEFINANLSEEEIENKLKYHFIKVNKSSKNKLHDFDKEFSKGFLASVYDYIKFKNNHY